MRYADNFDQDEDDDDFDDAETDAEMAEVIAQSNKNHEEELRLAERQIRHELLDKAIVVAKGSWFWGFYTNSYKIQKITEIYDIFEKLTCD